MNGLIRQWGGQIKDGVQVTFPIDFGIVAKVIISRVADSSSDTTNFDNSVQPLAGETGGTIKKGFTPHFGSPSNSGHYIAIGY